MGAEASVGEVMLPFGTQPRLRAEYANPTNTLVRMGKVLEDLDMLAGTTAWAHAFHHHMRREKKRKQQQEHQTSAGGEGLLGEPQVGLVTASMDRIRSYQPLSIEEDLQLRAAVTWTGRSSLEVMCTVKSGPRVALHACFVMVARSLLSDTPFLVPPLLAVTAEQKAQLQAAERRAARRLQERRSSQTTVPPTDEESLHALHLMANAAGRSARKMAGTRFQHNSISHIQDRNTNKTIYGGTLVRSGFEIAYIAAAVFLRVTPVFRQLNQLHFIRPVGVGTVLSLDAIVNYTDPERQLVYVRVNARAIEDLATPQLSTLTNTFQFTFAAPHTPEQVLPETYDEMMMYLEGYRASKRVIDHQIDEEVI